MLIQVMGVVEELFGMLEGLMSPIEHLVTLGAIL